MAYAFSEEIDRRKKKDSVILERARVLDDLRAAPPGVRYAAALFGSALIVYFGWFGLLAAFGVWRNHYFDLAQIGVIIGGLSVQLALAWVVRLRPVLGAIAFAALWTVPAALLCVAEATANDLLHAALYVLSPTALCLGSSVMFGRLLRRLDLPVFRMK